MKNCKVTAFFLPLFKINIQLKKYINRFIIRNGGLYSSFYSALQLEFEKDLNKLEFINEFQLSKEPLRIDVHIIKKIKDDILFNEIGNIFRKYNLVEYKSPDDYLSVEDYYKVHGYGCLYQSLAEIKEKWIYPI